MTPTVPGPVLATGEIRCLTGLRGIAALLVMFYHLSLNMPAGTIPFRDFLANGYLWVDLFFILSGFVLAYAHERQDITVWGAREYATFLASRLARIYPLYVVVILESGCLLLLRNGYLSPRVLGLNLAMVQGFGLAPSLEGAAWSVSTEWGAYLLFPFLLQATMAASRRAAWIAGVGAALSVVWLAHLPGTLALPDQGRSGPLDIYSSATPAPLLRCIAEFSLGLLCYRVARSQSHRLRRASGAIGLATMLVLLAALAGQGLDLVVVALFCVLLVMLSQQQGMLVGFLAARAPFCCGRWSYSIYLIHDKFSHPAEAIRAALVPYVPFASLLVVLATGGVIIVCSALICTFVEQPLRRLMMQRIPRPGRDRGSPPPKPSITRLELRT